MKTKNVEPITCDEARGGKNLSVPSEVIEAFNELIVENLDSNGHATVMQDAVVGRIVKKLNVSPEMIFKKHWLDVESLYEKKGWNVDYDKPAYNETYEAYFEFSRGRL